MSDDGERTAAVQARPPSPADVPSAVLDEALTLYRAGRLALEPLCRLMIQFGATPAATTAPHTTLAALLAAAASSRPAAPPEPEPLAPARAPSDPRQTRPLRTRPTPHPITTSAGTRLLRFTTARGVVPTLHPGRV